MMFDVSIVECSTLCNDMDLLAYWRYSQMTEKVKFLCKALIEVMYVLSVMLSLRLTDRLSVFLFNSTVFFDSLEMAVGFPLCCVASLSSLAGLLKICLGEWSM